MNLETIKKANDLVEQINAEEQFLDELNNIREVKALSIRDYAYTRDITLSKDEFREARNLFLSSITKAQKEIIANLKKQLEEL